VLDILRRCGEEERLRIAERARRRILAEHTAAHRAAEVENHAVALMSGVAA
jgi:spore maturation protein CgeB